MKPQKKSKPQSNGAKKPCKPLSRTKAGTSAKPKSTGKSSTTSKGSGTSLKRGGVKIRWAIKFEDGEYVTYATLRQAVYSNKERWIAYPVIKLEIREVG